MNQSKKLCLALAAMAIAGAPFGVAGCTNAAGDVGLAEARKKMPPPEEEGLCRLTGGGRIVAGEEPDSFGGNAQPFFWGIDGEWEHQTHEGTGDEGNFHGDPDSITCFNVGGDDESPPEAGFNAIVVTGTGSLGDAEDCTFRLYVEDHGEPGSAGDTQLDYYEITIECPGEDTYTAGDSLLDGNLQIHAVPPNRLPAMAI